MPDVHYHPVIIPDFGPSHRVIETQCAGGRCCAYDDPMFPHIWPYQPVVRNWWIFKVLRHTCERCGSTRRQFRLKFHRNKGTQ
jgi:hypothetical protein